MRAWVLTDGKAGDETGCLGVAEALGLTPEIRRVAPHAPWVWVMPWGPVDPREAPGRPGSPIAPPFPDLAIASGRRAVPYLRQVRRASQGKTFTVFLKDPRTGADTADLVWVPEHDRLRGENVLATLTSPHRVSAARLAAARAAPPAGLAALPVPRVALIIGGDSRHHRFTPADIDALVERIRLLAASGASLMMTPSRRTPPLLRDRIATLVREHGGWAWDGTGENPYLPMLALADMIVVTADSVNMIGEAAATGRPVCVFHPSGGHARIGAFIAALERKGVVRPFTGRLESFSYQPIDSTPVIADVIRKALADRGIVPTHSK